MVEQETRECPRALTGGGVQLTITIGDGQLGGSSMKLDGKPVGPTGDITKVRIGAPSALRGKDLEVRTLVGDVNLQSNWTSVTYEFTGVDTAREVAQHRVKTDGNAVLFRTTFHFA
jgi:hypothetical protein